MNHPVRALVTAVGGDFGQAIVKALRLAQSDLVIHGSDSAVGSAGEALVNHYHVLPQAASKEAYLDRLDRLCREEGLDAVVPASESEIRVLCEWSSSALPSGAKVVCQPEAWIRRYGDKLSCMRALDGAVDLAGYADGANRSEVRVLAGRVGFPLVVKARRGSGSRSVRVAADEAALDQALREGKAESVVQEYIDDAGGEFSVGLFACPSFRAVIVLRRELGGLGCSWYAETSDDREVTDYAQRVMEATGLEGAANLQVRKSSRGVRLLEINARFSSLVALRALAGFRDAEWALYSALGIPLTPPQTPYRKVRFQRFFHELVDQGDGYGAVCQWLPRICDGG